MSLLDVNYFAVVIGVILNIIIGAFWYSPKFLGIPWAKAHNFDLETLKPTPFHYVGAIIVGFILAWTLAAFISALHAHTAVEGMKVAFFAWLGFIATTHFSGVIWAKKPLNAYFIDVGGLLVSMILMGAIFGAWS